ncbi:DNA/RNA non-specific endonuclease [Holzapfeliella sp. He02]|uniref:DNA/RNA non-specific endonuclease n=1 Tax=Holzapfeliella saturejae TaxID=3082953 RepID=A0ABU8SI61_9LACO
MKNQNQQKVLVTVIVAALIIFFAFFGTNKDKNQNQTQQNQQNSSLQSSNKQSSSKQSSQQSSSSESQNANSQYQTQQSASTTQKAQELAQLSYSGTQIIAVDNNNPGFTAEELAQKPFQYYAPLDNLKRATYATAMLHKSLMPTAQRERLTVNPTGYINKRITINGKEGWLYNRAHLIGYQFTGQNNNLNNLMTGTRSLNDPGMTFYENKMAQYLRSTGHHILYYVQPVYRGDEKVARGMWMRAESVEDKEIQFNIYIFNVQEGYTIDYQTGALKN